MDIEEAAKKATKRPRNSDPTTVPTSTVSDGVVAVETQALHYKESSHKQQSEEAATSVEKGAGEASTDGSRKGGDASKAPHEGDSVVACNSDVIGVSGVESSSPPSLPPPKAAFFCALCLTLTLEDPVVIHAGHVLAYRYGITSSSKLEDLRHTHVNLDEQNKQGFSRRSPEAIAPSNLKSARVDGVSAPNTLLPSACLACRSCADRWAVQTLKQSCGEAIAMLRTSTQDIPLLVRNTEKEGNAFSVALPTGASLQLSFNGPQSLTTDEDSAARATAIFVELNGYDCPVCDACKGTSLKLTMMSSESGVPLSERDLVLAALRRGALLGSLKASSSSLPITMHPFVSLASWRKAARTQFNRITGAYQSGTDSLAPQLKATTSTAALSASSGTTVEVGAPAAGAASRKVSRKGPVGAVSTSTTMSPVSEATCTSVSVAIVLNQYTGAPDDGRVLVGPSVNSNISSMPFVPLCSSPMKRRIQSARAESPLTSDKNEPQHPFVSGGAVLSLLAEDVDLNSHEGTAPVGGSDALSPSMCGACEEERGSVDCLECGFPLCEGCLQATHSKGRYKTHTIMAIGHASKKKGRRCPEHPDQILELYCVDCRVCVCVRCCFIYSHASASGGVGAVDAFRGATPAMMMGSRGSRSLPHSGSPASSLAGGFGSGHNGHNVVPLQKTIESIAEALAETSGAVSVWQRRAAKASRTLLRALPTISKKEEWLVGDIRRHFDQLRQALEHSEKEAISSVRSFLKQQSSTVSSAAIAYKESAEEADRLKKAMREITEETHPTVVVCLQDVVVKRVRSAAEAVARICELSVAASACCCDDSGSDGVGGGSFIHFDPDVAHVLSSAVTSVPPAQTDGDSEDDGSSQEEEEETDDAGTTAAGAPSQRVLDFGQLPPVLQLLLAPLLPNIDGLVFEPVGGSTTRMDEQDHDPAAKSERKPQNPLLQQAIRASFEIKYPPLPIVAAENRFIIPAQQDAAGSNEVQKAEQTSLYASACVDPSPEAASLFRSLYEALMAASNRSHASAGLASEGVTSPTAYPEARSDEHANEELEVGDDYFDDVHVRRSPVSPQKGEHGRSMRHVATSSDQNQRLGGRDRIQHHSEAYGTPQRYESENEHVRRAHTAEAAGYHDRASATTAPSSKQFHAVSRTTPTNTTDSRGVRYSDETLRNYVRSVTSKVVDPQQQQQQTHGYGSRDRSDCGRGVESRPSSNRYSVGASGGGVRNSLQIETQGPHTASTTDSFLSSSPIAPSAVAPTLAPSPPRGAASRSRAGESPRQASPHLSGANGNRAHVGHDQQRTIRRYGGAATRLVAGGAHESDEDGIGLMVGGAPAYHQSSKVQPPPQQTERAPVVGESSASKSGGHSRPPTRTPPPAVAGEAQPYPEPRVSGRATLGGIARIFQMGTARQQPQQATAGGIAGGQKSEREKKPSPARAPASSTAATGGIRLHI